MSPLLSSIMKIGIVGAGLAGLQQARALQKRNIDFHKYETKDKVGGVWVNTQLQAAQGGTFERQCGL